MLNYFWTTLINLKGNISKTNIDNNISRLEKNVKELIKDLGKDGLKKESVELASLYKKHIIEFKVKMKQFEKKYHD